MSLKKFSGFVQRLHSDEKGEMPIGPMLLLGLIVIPIVILLIMFRDDIMDWVSSEGGKMLESGKKSPGPIGS